MLNGLNTLHSSISISISTRALASHTIKVVAVIAAALLGLLTSSICSAQFLEDFSGDTASWERRDTDCVVSERDWTQRRLAGVNDFEQIHFSCGPGTKLLMAHEVPPSFVIPELIPSVRIKSSRPGIQLMARIVLPETPAPSGEGVMTTLISGPKSETSGRWETLSFGTQAVDLRKLLQREAWVLRKRFGSHVSLQNAYIDKIVLNIYTGSGKADVHIDDLKLNGIVSAEKIADSLASAGSNEKPVVRQVGFTQDASNEPQQKMASLVIRDGTVLEVKKKPFFPRIIQHNGESFEFLQSLGFNTIELKTTASFEQLQNAQRLDMWLICSPPVSAGKESIPFQYDRVLAWSLGQNLSGRDLKNFSQRAIEVRHSDLREGRPIVAAANSDWSNFGNVADVLAIGFQPMGSSFIVSQYSDWIRQRSAAIGDSKPIWAAIQTEYSPALLKQVAAITQSVPPTPIEPTQLKFLTYEAIAGGARGLRFISSNRLDQADPATRLRALSVNWINDQVKQLEPWAVGGAVMGELELNDNHLEVTALNTARSRLLLIQRPTHHEQYWAGDTPMKTIEFEDTASAFTDRAYRITDDGLMPLPNSRNHGGAQIRIENCPYTTAVVLTQDPMVVKSLSQAYDKKIGASRMTMHMELTQQWLAIMQLIDNQLSRAGRSTASSSGAINEAMNALRKGESLISAGSPLTSVDFINRAEERMAFARREILATPLGQFQSKTSTPLLTHVSLIPMHWQLTQQLSQASWNPNGLPGGDFENLELMLKNGWENRRRDSEEIATLVELSEDAVVGGKYGLKISARPKSDHPGLVESTPVWISTSHVSVRPNQMVRIHGWVNVPRTITGNHNGLMIIDSLGGAPLAERIPITNGWQEFTLYRNTSDRTSLKVTFALTGIGEAYVDEVTIRTVDLPEVLRQAKK